MFCETPHDAAQLPDQILSPLPDPFRCALLSMYAGEPQLGEDGKLHVLDGTTNISPEEGMWLYELCRKVKPQATLEIGLAYGFSTVYFLAAMPAEGNAHHTAIDPFQRRAPGRWEGIGLEHGRRFGGERFRFIEKPSSSALVRLAEHSEHFEIIFVDGRHLFDLALLDFTLSAELCPTGGYIILDDMWLASIQRVAAFVKANRNDFVYNETPIANIAVFRRTGTDDRKFKHFVEF